MKLIMMKGLPASGKSTRAKEIVESGGQFIRVNRDLIRTMLHFDRFTGKNEGITVNVERAVVVNALSNGCNVVVDDCNLNPGNAEMWKQVAKECGADFKVEEVKTDYATCITRDRSRAVKALGGGQVGDHVILGMALQYGLYPKPEKGFVLCDIDGTLADVTHRLHHVKVPEGQKKNWGEFFAAMSDDPVRIETVDRLLKYEEEGYDIIIVSARPDTYRTQTEAWLDEAFKGYPLYKALVMRRSNDSRDDVEVKGDMYEKLFKHYPIHVVIDDRPKVIRMWREKGLDVIDVGSGVEF